MARRRNISRITKNSPIRLHDPFRPQSQRHAHRNDRHQQHCDDRVYVTDNCGNDDHNDDDDDHDSHHNDGCAHHDHDEGGGVDDRPNGPTPERADPAGPVDDPARNGFDPGPAPYRPLTAGVNKRRMLMSWRTET